MELLGGLISYDTSSLRQAENELGDIAGQVKSIAQELDGEVMPQLKSGWTGANSDEYMKKFTKVNEKVLAFSGYIVKVQRLTDSIAARAEKAEMLASILPSAAT